MIYINIVFVVAAVGVICLYYIWKTTVDDYNISIPMESIYSIATRDLSVIGVYDRKLTITMRYWVYAILVAAYKKGLSEEVYHVIKLWNTKNCDKDGIIYEGIELGRTKFLNDIRDAAEKGKDVVFKVDPSYDYHDYPSYFVRNEFLLQDDLLEEVDKILGGDVSSATSSTLDI